METCTIKNGIVQQVNPQSLVVRVSNASACAGCHAKSGCTAVDHSDSLMVIDRLPGTDYKPGDVISLKMEDRKGLQAVFWGYLFPLILVILTLIIASQFTTEARAGIIALLTLLPYYLILRSFKTRLDQKFRITLSDD